jgi:predicted membrane-bound spermidine synthase
MKNSSEADKPVSNWAVLGALLVFGAAYLVWALGFDAVAGWLAGGSMEAVLSWATRVWLWLVVGAFVLALAVGSWARR